MKLKTITPIQKLCGEIILPGDKSISHRALMIGAISHGLTKVKGILDCDDCNYTMRAFKDMGIAITQKGHYTTIHGKGLRGLQKPPRPLYVGNSGTTMRLLAGILAGQDFKAAIVGDESLSNRPMKRIVEPLSRMGVDINARDGKYPPLVIRGDGVKPERYVMPIPSAQVKSAILFAGLYARGITRVEERYKSRDHTERMLKHFGADIDVRGTSVSLRGGRSLKGKSFEIPGDISSASFFITGATLLAGSRIMIKNVSINPTRTGIVSVLAKMGARIKVINKKELFEPVGDIVIESNKTYGITVEEGMIPSIIDELPIFFVLASLSEGRSVVKGAEELRVKETDRVTSMLDNLKRMGAKIAVKRNTIIIDGVASLHKARLKSFGDHRTCMAMTIAALTAKGKSEIEGTESISKSFPEFFEVLERLSR